MAGIAAFLSFDSDLITIERLSEALAPRGSDETAVEFGAARLLVRAELPKVFEAGGVAAIVDGIAETSTLLSRYQSQGPAGLLYGHHPYALILAEPDGLVLARHLDGPPLYYATLRGTVLAASEPKALLAAGLPLLPNAEVVARFLESGECDGISDTFIDGIRRVLPGQTVEITRQAIRENTPLPPRADPGFMASMSLRFAVVADPSLSSTALLGAARAGGRHVPVYSLDRSPDIDVDSFAADLGEPVPDLADYLLWSVARETRGEVDVLLSARPAAAHLSRLADRVASRYGVALRFPLRDKKLAPDAAPILALREVLERLRPEIAAALLYPAYGEPDHIALSKLANLGALALPELERLWRHYVLQRWLTPLPPLVLRAAPPGEVAGWHRQLVHTEPVGPSEEISDKFAWYLAEFINSSAKATRHALRQPWLVAIAAKPVAVAQGQARAVWQIKPGWLARMLVRFKGGDALTAQAAVERFGLVRGWTGYPGNVSAPREHAFPPAHLAVVGPPRNADRVAKEIVEALCRDLPDSVAASLRGVAIVHGTQIRGWAGTISAPVNLITRLCEDDPFGQDGELTPLLVAFQPGGRERPA